MFTATKKYERASMQVASLMILTTWLLIVGSIRIAFRSVSKACSQSFAERKAEISFSMLLIASMCLSLIHI